MKILRKNKVLSFLSERSRREKVFCPQSDGGKDLMLLPLGEGAYTGEIGKTVISAKGILFPQTEDVISFQGKSILKITESNKTLVFGIRPCEMKAIQFTDRFMSRDQLIDPHYDARRKGLTTVVVACHAPPSETCFCLEAGGMPYLENAYDVQLFDAGEYYIAMAGTERGEKILADEHFRPASGDHGEKLEAIKHKALQSKMISPGFHMAVESLKQDKADEAFWERLADRCINCGSCVYVCPTCTCFNVYDLPVQGGYVRCRSWDACMHAGFTRETSGHNPRATQGSRLARRHEHKLKFDMINFAESGCVGCGRCSDACPVGLGAIEIIKELSVL